MWSTADTRVADRSVMDRSVVGSELLGRKVMYHEVVDRGVVYRRVVDRGVVDGSRCPRQLWVHTNQQYTPRIDRCRSVASSIGHPRSDRRHFRNFAYLLILTIHSSSLLPYSPVCHCRKRSSTPVDVHPNE